MLKRLIALAVLAMLAVISAAGSAWAAPATVQLRVEGATATIFEGPVTTGGKVITKGGNTLACDGSTANPPQPPGPTMTSALDDGLTSAGIQWEATFFDDFFIAGINGEMNDTVGNRYWGYALNTVAVQVGGCQQQVRSGDEVLYGFDFFSSNPALPSKPLLKLTGPARVATGAQANVTVTDGSTGAAFPGATVGGTQTGADGTASITLSSPGLVRLKAEAPGAIRSNALVICASPSGQDDCGVPPGQLGAPSSRPGLARDSRAPTARVASPQNGAVYRRGPRLLRGTASDDQSGVAEVKLALRRHVGGACRWWSGRRERFVGRNCRKTFYFSIGPNADWSYQLPRALPRGRYVLDVKAFDRARNRDDRPERGRSQVVFRVVPVKVRKGQGRAAHGRPPRISVMVAGRGGLLVEATSLRAKAVSVRASGRSCRVPPSTPLAALVRALSRANIGYHVRDFGRCSSRRASSSGQLFVDRIGDERNRGGSGWFYKVDGRAGTTGAADPSAVAGGGLRAGQRVLWFFCEFDTAARSCQPSLDALPARAGGKPGDSLRVRVRALDNEGASRAAPGAGVTLGPVSARSDDKGFAQLALPAPGRYLLRASKQGTVPSFPVKIVVGDGA